MFILSTGFPRQLVGFINFPVERESLDMKIINCLVLTTQVLSAFDGTISHFLLEVLFDRLLVFVALIAH